jgi:hypothetical protein
MDRYIQMFLRGSDPHGSVGSAVAEQLEQLNKNILASFNLQKAGSSNNKPAKPVQPGVPYEQWNPILDFISQIRKGYGTLIVLNSWQRDFISCLSDYPVGYNLSVKQFSQLQTVEAKCRKYPRTPQPEYEPAPLLDIELHKKDHVIDLHVDFDDATRPVQLNNESFIDFQERFFAWEKDRQNKPNFH